MLTFLPEGTRLYRARLCDSPDVLKAIYEHPFLYVGPPPPAKARAGRMNAEGVVVLYASTDPDTCLAEMRPPLGGNTAVIELKTIKTLQLLNFRRLSKCYKQLSYFQENYADELDRFKFLRFLERRISKPIIPGDEAEYLITETMTEYLAYVHPIAFDGIMYSSAQRSEGINVVLFGHRSDEYYLPAAKFPVAYVNESLKFFSTQAISYTHHEEQMSLIADSVVSDSCPYPYDETNTNYQL